MIVYILKLYLGLKNTPGVCTTQDVAIYTDKEKLLNNLCYHSSVWLEFGLYMIYYDIKEIIIYGKLTKTCWLAVSYYHEKLKILGCVGIDEPIPWNKQAVKPKTLKCKLNTVNVPFLNYFKKTVLV